MSFITRPSSRRAYESCGSVPKARRVTNSHGRAVDTTSTVVLLCTLQSSHFFVTTIITFDASIAKSTPSSVAHPPSCRMDILPEVSRMLVSAPRAVTRLAVIMYSLDALPLQAVSYPLAASRIPTTYTFSMTDRLGLLTRSELNDEQKTQYDALVKYTEGKYSGM